MEDEEICPSRTKNTIDHFGVTQFNRRTVGTYIHTRSTWIRSSRARRPPYSRADLHTLHNRPALALFNLEKAASSPHRCNYRITDDARAFSLPFSFLLSHALSSGNCRLLFATMAPSRQTGRAFVSTYADLNETPLA